uniref:Laminin subunit alpha 3 n=1 Tax=Dicentrarchus labrax TaxID=13489 RepID=A0A8C4F1H6_DICLA
MARGMRGAHLLALFFTFLITLFVDADGQETSNGLTGFSLNPPYFNLAQGTSISATATCGQDESGTPRYDLYCKLVGGPTGVLTQNIQGQFCDYCNTADPSKAHPVTNAIDGTERWWQSPPLSRGPGYNEVNVTLDLGQLFHVAYVLIKFANSPRPDLWVLERSVDNGRTFKPWQYFAHSKRECIEKFGKQPNARILNDDDQLCTTEYSRIVPLENGEIVVSLVNGRPGSKNFTYSPVLQDFTKATNIRLSFLRTTTLLGHLISKAQRDPTVTRRYYYSIKDISIGGRCVCHGHAQVCGSRRDQDNPNRLQCECQHNTCGESCDRCCPGFNQKPWRAATVDSPNECHACQCFSHAFDCYYDPEVERRGASLDTFGRYNGGGVCINCQHNTAGVNCERCLEGFYRPFGVPPESPTGCIPCRCDEMTTAGCEMGSGRCICKPQFTGENCDRCADGYYSYPQCIRKFSVFLITCWIPSLRNGWRFLNNLLKYCHCYFFSPLFFVFVCIGPTACPTGYFGSPSCQRCICDYRGTAYGVCDASGRCLCRQGVEGEQCDRCQPGYHSFPNCQACLCDGAGVADNVCTPSGHCVCFPNYGGQECDECAPGYYGYPDSCQCSQEGSYGSICNPLSGQCLCIPGVVGQQCDRCASGLRFPQCSGNHIRTHRTNKLKGNLCDRCKPLYWNLVTDNPRGCIECQCDVKGTLSGVGECEQKSGQCHCKPNACGHACDTCKDGYFLLQKKKYFGCQGCQCDVGGAVSMACNEMSGQCQCRKNVVGRKCTEPAPSYYFPTLHQLKFEVEDGITPNARPVRFGYNPQEFPDFSWRGYAVMSPAQPEVILTLTLGFPGLFHIIMLFCALNCDCVTLQKFLLCCSAGSGQSKEVIFPESSSPSFLTVPGEGFAEPFALTPGKWIIHIRAEGVLLDYLVLLPRDYYEAHLLQEKITQPCTYLPTANKDTNCLLYKHVAMDGFSSALGSEGILSSRSGRRRRQARVRRPTPDHPEMAALNGRQVHLRVPRPGPYALVLEYASEVDTVQNVNILISGQSDGYIPARANIHSLFCSFIFLCRSVAVDGSNHITMLQLSHKTEILLQTSTTSFLLYKVYAVPAEEFSIEYVDPKVLCVSTHGRFTEDRYVTLNKPQCMLLITCQAQPGFCMRPVMDSYLRHQLFIPHEDLLLILFQTEISFTPNVPLPGRYVVVVHYHQPEHTSFPVEVRVDAGREWKGSINASFCPAVSGCREVVISDGRIALDFDQNSWQPPTISVIVPPRKTLILDYILLIPDSSYTPDLLKEKPLDKSADFIQQCRGEGFYIDPRTSSQFCRDSARSLVAAYNDGALPCDCDKSGSTGTTCDAVGGQCPCRQHIIGRQCTKCATGYYACECGRRLCDEVTGRCICPPQTVKPSCDACQSQTFSYHPLLGCEGCECSPNGIKANAGPDCDRITGQCTCKPRIWGRQCDRCAPGYYRFPDCVPCDCNQGGVTPAVCHPDTGRCLCKKNVAGGKCDICREGSFYFDPSSPHGCTSCFCFGATDQCQSSSKRILWMQAWRLESPDQEVSSVLNTASNTVVADIQELPPTVQTLHWVAPSSYLGDRVSQRGSEYLYFLLSETQLIYPFHYFPQGQDMTLIHMAPQVPLPDRLYQGRVQLLEGNWRHAITNRPVSREELMMVLAGLVGLRIRALYFTQTQRLSLGEVGLEEATNTGTGGPGNTVEDCSCPPQYTGDSCEKCAPGYYRDGSGLFVGRCVPCECNGLSDECEEKTGKCLNCKYNTAGDRCERCKEGYYGNADQRTCRVCPCPFSVPTNSFAIGCREVFGDFQCICRAGYTGDKCESCAPGYYGDPLIPGGSCQPCNCNGNGNNCDPRTGVCVCVFEALLDQLKTEGSTGVPPNQNLAKMLEDAERMVKEMQNRNFTPQKTAADEEKDEAKKRKILMLNYIKANVSKQCDQNEATAEKIRGLLKDYQDKLKDLDEALKEATDLVKKANNQNGLNAQGLKDLQVQEYEQLAAQLDGAKTDLTKKVNEISKAAAKEDIVVAAEQHAKKLDKLAKELEEVHVPSTFLFKSDDIGGMIDEAKRSAASANDTASDTMDKLNAIRKEIDKINVSPVDSNLSSVLDDVDQSVKNLLKTIPSLNDKISEVENLTSQFSPISNITENIKKIKDLIEQARDAANRVRSHSFSGDGHVQLRPPKNLEDLKAYTALSLLLQRPEMPNRGDGRRRRRQASDNGDMFVMYLGNKDSSKNYIGMVLRNNVLYGNGNVVNTMKVWIFITLFRFRIYQDANINLIKDVTTHPTAEPIKNGNKGEESENLLDLSPDDVVFYVGGYPDNFTPPPSLSYPMYKGCIEFSSFNDKALSLYNFQNAEKINSVCETTGVTLKPFISSVFQSNGMDIALKNGYVILNFNNGIWKSNKQYNDDQWHYVTVTKRGGRYERGNGFTFKHILHYVNIHTYYILYCFALLTRAPEGLLFFSATRGGRSHLALYISKGRIRLSVGKQKEIFNREKYNDGKWHSVIFSLEKKKFRLVVDGIRAQDGQLTSAELTSMQQFVSPVYLGSTLANSHKHAVSGCIRNFKMNGAPMSNPSTNRGAGPCFEGQAQRGAYFSGNGAHVIINDSFDVGSSFELLFNIRPRSLSGLLLHVGDSSRTHSVCGSHLQVVAKVNNGKGEFMVAVKPKASLCDGLFHKISVIKRKNVVQLHVDTIDNYKIGPPSSITTLTKDPLYVGGIPEMLMQRTLPVTSSFVGCIQEMRLNGDSVSFDRLSGAFGPINLKECPG